MFCPRCGRDNPEAAKYCNECGFALHEIQLALRKQDEPASMPESTGTASSAQPAGEMARAEPHPASPPDRPVAVPGEHTVPVPAGQGPDQPPAGSAPISRRIRSPSVAVLLSIIPGLGQVYNGNLPRGILLFLGTLAGLLILIVPGVCIWIYGIYDAYRTACRINRDGISSAS